MVTRVELWVVKLCTIVFAEKKSLGDECGSLKDEVAKLGSKLFALEQQLKKNNFESDKAGKLELEVCCFSKVISVFYVWKFLFWFKTWVVWKF